MKCSNCQTENPDGAKFCMNCGHVLAVSCPNCGTKLPPTAAFCFNCGYKLASPQDEAKTENQPESQPAPQQVGDTSSTKSYLERYIPQELLTKLETARESGAMEGERRIVTMLFCDVKGSTAAAGQLDPEEWADIINGTFEHLIKPVYQYEGTVARLMGDGILAFFGAPIAHEDDPQRAILAGLDILDGIQVYREQVKRQWEFDLDVRVGINTGLVVVGAVGSDLRMEYTALGDAINLAARMEQTAQPGTVQIAEPTYKLVAPLFEVENLGGIRVKGKDEPVQSYRVLGLKSEPGQLRGIEGLESPMIGRDAELHALRGAIIELRRGRGQIISVIGEAGLGKSRLIAELRKMPSPVSKADVKLRWEEGRSLSYETTTPYAPFIHLLTNCFELEDDQSDEDKCERIITRVTEVMPDRVGDIAPFLASLLAITLTGEALQRVKYLEPPQLRSRVFKTVSDFLAAMATKQPVVLVFDDVHWIDPTSLELLEQLLPLTERVMLMLIVLFRPRRQEPSWHFHEVAEREFSHRYTTIHLNPLSDDDSRELVANLLHVDDLPIEVRNLILAKSEGNPFYVEEVVRSLLDDGLVVRKHGHWQATRQIKDISMPDTLSAVITSRLDKLDENSKRAVQTAAVIGRQFQLDILQDIYQQHGHLDQSLTDLQRRELIREKSRVPKRVYIFKHALTQETAYNSLLLKKRSQLHARVGEILEKRDPERVNDIARHFLAARQNRRALPYLVEAGEHAARAYSTSEAIGYFEQALKILETEPDIALARRAYEGLGSILTFANDIQRAIETYQTMLALAETSGDIPMEVSALNKLSFISALRLGQFEEAENYLAEADHLARANEDKHGLSEHNLIRCMMCTAVADFEGVELYMAETVALGRELDAREQMALGLAHIASSQAYMLRFEESEKSLQEGLKLSREIGDREHEAEFLAGTGTTLSWVKGELDAAQESAEEGLHIARNIDSVNIMPLALRMLGVITHQKGVYEQAIEYYEQYLQVSRTAGIVWCEVEALCLLGTVYLDISPVLSERTIELHSQATKLMEHPAGTMLGGTAWAELGFCEHIIGDRYKANEFFEKGLTTPTITTNLEKPRLLVGSALVAMAEGKLDEAAILVGEANTFVMDNGLRIHAPLVAFAAAKINAAQGNTERALEQYAFAGELAQEIGLPPLVWQALAGEAQVLNDAGRIQNATARQEAAQSVVDEIAASFTDEELRRLYLENAALKVAVPQ